MKIVRVSFLILALGAWALTRADPPPGYYAPAEGKASAELRSALHTIIGNHHVVPYESTGTDTADALKVLDQDPDNLENVLLLYSTSAAPAASFDTGWNREHLWPQSYGLDETARSDLFNLRACDSNVNSSRGNKFYDFSDTTDDNYRSPAHVEAFLCTTDPDSWEPPEFQRGDIARSLFYMATRYTGDNLDEPLLVLKDDTSVITSANSYMGKLSTLLAWHHADPVDAVERLRNDRIYSLYQTNRNPFVDHPEWVNLTFAPSHTNAPVLLIELSATGTTLRWLATNQSTRLEYTTNLNEAWRDSPLVPALHNAAFELLITNTGVSSFFRLRVLSVP